MSVPSPAHPTPHPGVDPVTGRDGVFPPPGQSGASTRLPDLRRLGLEGVPPALARRVGDAALGLTYRLWNASRRDPYLAGLRDWPLGRVYYRAVDGWSAPLFHLPPAPGGSGEPVLLAHGLGGTHRDWSMEPSRCLARTLADAGFAVYLLEHRGDRSAQPPPGALPFSVDDIAVRDVDAALDAIRERSGYPRVLWVGHGLGAQLLALRLALVGADGLAGAALLAGAARFPVVPSTARAAGVVSVLLPPGWVLPARRAAQLASPFVADGETLASPDTEGPVARARLRYATGDLHAGVLRQVSRWVATGTLTDATGRLDVVGALRPFPSLVVEPDADPACPPEAAAPLAEALDAERLVLAGGWGHLDPLVGARAPEVVHPAVLAFLHQRRRHCW